MKSRFEYKYTVRRSDLWQASMYYAYSSYMGVVNVVFAVSAVVLLVTRWNTSSDIFKALMVVLAALFTVIQPLAVWIRAGSSVKEYPELTLEFSEEGIKVAKDEKTSRLSWNDIKGIVRKPTLLIIYIMDGSGYILRNSVLKNTKNDLYEFVVRMKKGDR